MSDQDIRTEMLEAAKMHVPFDGWSDAALAAAARDAGVDIALARAVFPRGGVDLALAYHEAGDRAMLDRLEAEADTLAAMRFRDRIAAAVRFRIEAIDDRELARRGATLFALPQHAPDGARAIWRTCDRIWTAVPAVLERPTRGRSRGQRRGRGPQRGAPRPPRPPEKVPRWRGRNRRRIPPGWRCRCGGPGRPGW